MNQNNIIMNNISGFLNVFYGCHYVHFWKFVPGCVVEILSILVAIFDF